LLIAISTSVFGFIRLEDTFERVGPKSVSGFFRTQVPEKRVEDCNFYLERVEQALSRGDPQAALADLHYGQRVVADLSQSELATIVESGWEIYDELVENEDLNADPGFLPQIEQLEATAARLFPPPTGIRALSRGIEMFLGTDMQGRSISLRAVYSIEVAFKLGLVVAFLSVTVGSLMGAAAAYFGGWVDYVVTWLFTTFSSIPSLVLLVLLAYMFTDSVFEGTLVPIYIAFSATYWIGPCRVLRGETLKLKELEYVQAATAVGFGRPYIMVKHILPNASHLMLINFSLLFIAAIKGEVILTFLGLGIKNGTSWGIMIDHSRPEVINGFFWQIGTATFLMFVLVLAFNILSDALQDAFDPKHV
jgi:peptide/nickel transport system permease protein